MADSDCLCTEAGSRPHRSPTGRCDGPRAENEPRAKVTLPKHSELGGGTGD